MRKGSKIALFAGLECCIIGGIFGVIGWFGGGIDYIRHTDLNSWNGAAGEQVISEMEKTEIDPVQELNVELSGMDFAIKTSEDEHCYLAWRASSGNREDQITYQQNDGVLSIKEKNTSHHVYLDISFWEELPVFTREERENRQNLVTLYLPADTVLHDVSVNSSYGDLGFSSVQIQKGNIQTADGDLTFENCHLKQLQISSSLGDIESTGGSWDEVEAKTADGDIDLSKTALQGNISMESDLGDLDIEINEGNLKNLQIEAATDLGEIEAPEALAGRSEEEGSEASYSYAPKETKGRLELKTSDGDITLESAS